MPPAARVGDMHICPMWDGPKPHVGGPIMPIGVPNVLIGGLPAATVGSLCACAGAPDIIVRGSTCVLIGGMQAARMGDSTAHGGTIMIGFPNVLIGDAGSGGTSAGNKVSQNTTSKKETASKQKDIDNSQSLKEAANKGEATASKKKKADYTAQFTLLDGAQKAKPNVRYVIKTSDGKQHDGQTDSSGKTQTLQGYTDADCSVAFINK